MKTHPPNTCSIPEKTFNPDWRLETLRPLLKKFQQSLISPVQEKVRINQQSVELVSTDDKGLDNSL
jgi:hypothetical protein